MIIKSDHPALSTCQEIKEISKPLNRLGISHFSYTRLYKNGERIYLVSNPKIVENFLNKKHYLDCGNESHPDHYINGQIVLWQPFAHQTAYQEAAAMDVAHGIYLFEQNEGYCESYSYATSKNNEGIINAYFNNLDILKAFPSYFKEKAGLILKQAEQNKFSLLFNDTYQKIEAYKPYSTDTDKLSNLSKRQRDCAYYLVQGNSVKFIARKLNLSSRTVENYIAHMKLKLNCSNKYELILKLQLMLNQSKFFDSFLK